MSGVSETVRGTVSAANARSAVTAPSTLIALHQETRPARGVSPVSRTVQWTVRGRNAQIAGRRNAPALGGGSGASRGHQTYLPFCYLLSFGGTI